MHGTSILYDDPLGDTLYISVTASTTLNGSAMNIFSQGTTNASSRGGDLTLKTGSASSGKSGILGLLLGNYASAASISIAEASLAARVVGLCLSQASMDSTLMPAGTGDNVVYIGNATSAPSTADPVSGVILYAQAGVLKIRQSDGTDITIGDGFTSATTSLTFADPGSGDPISLTITDTAVTNGGDFEIFAQNTTFGSATGGDVVLRGGDSTSGLAGRIVLYSGNSTNIGIALAETSLGYNNIGLAVNYTSFGVTQMPANTGDGVIYIGDAATAPSTGSPVDGTILYSLLGELRIKQSDGIEYKIGSQPEEKTITSTDVVYFPLDNVLGTTTITNAGSGTAFTLSLTNTAVFEFTTPVGDGCLIAGDAFFQGVGTAKTYQGSVTNFTAECWVEFIEPVTISPNTLPFFGKEQGGAGDVTFTLGIDLTSSYQLVNAVKTSVTGMVIIPVAKLEPWVRYHVVMTYDGANVKSYINSNLIVTTPCTGTLVWDNTYSWSVGNVGSGTSFFILRGCRFSDTAKTGATIKQIYLSGRPSW